MKMREEGEALMFTPLAGQVAAPFWVETPITMRKEGLRLREEAPRARVSTDSGYSILYRKPETPNVTFTHLAPLSFTTKTHHTALAHSTHCGAL